MCEIREACLVQGVASRPGAKATAASASVAREVEHLQKVAQFEFRNFPDFHGVRGGLAGRETKQDQVSLKHFHSALFLEVLGASWGDSERLLGWL